MLKFDLNSQFNIEFNRLNSHLLGNYLNSDGCDDGKNADPAAAFILQGTNFDRFVSFANCMQCTFHKALRFSFMKLETQFYTFNQNPFMQKQ